MKKSLFIIVFCFMGYLSIGQTGSGSLYFSPHDGSNSIVRYVPSTGKHIVYSEYNNSASIRECHFTLTDMVNDIDAHIAENYHINDFEIIDNFVIFCGYFPYGPGVKTGIIGWFDIDSLFNYGVSATIDVSLHILGMETLDNIEVFRDITGQIHIVGYGETSTPSGGLGTYYRVFEAIGTLPGFFSWRTSNLGRYGTYSSITDMAVTDNYVIFLGWERNFPNSNGIGITLHPLPKYSMISSYTIKSYYFELHNYNNPSLPSNSDEPFNAPRITHSTGDNVAVCSYRNELVPSLTYYLSHWTFDISPVLSGFPIQMISATRAQLPGYVFSIDGILYDVISKNYVILHSHDLGGGASDYAVTTIDFSSGTVPAYIVSDYQTAYPAAGYWLPKSFCMDRFSQYTVSGHKHATTTYDHVLWHNIIYTINGRCSNSVTYILQQIRIFPPEEKIFNADLQGWKKIVFGHEYTVTMHPFPCINICPQTTYKQY